MPQGDFILKLSDLTETLPNRLNEVAATTDERTTRVVLQIVIDIFKEKGEKVADDS